MEQKSEHFPSSSVEHLLVMGGGAFDPGAIVKEVL